MDKVFEMIKILIITIVIIIILILMIVGYSTMVLSGEISQQERDLEYNESDIPI